MSDCFINDIKSWSVSVLKNTLFLFTMIFIFILLTVLKREIIQVVQGSEENYNVLTIIIMLSALSLSLWFYIKITKIINNYNEGKIKELHSILKSLNYYKERWSQCFLSLLGFFIWGLISVLPNTHAKQPYIFIFQIMLVLIVLLLLFNLYQFIKLSVSVNKYTIINITIIEISTIFAACFLIFLMLRGILLTF